MKRMILVTISAFLIMSCGTTTSLYYWGGTTKGTTAYENSAYKNYDKQTPESLCQLICIYEDMVKNPGGTRKMPPPGICAEYGYILLIPETAHIFSEYATSAQKKMLDATDFTQKGKELLEMEIRLYPESIKFVKPLMEKLCDR